MLFVPAVYDCKCTMLTLNTCDLFPPTLPVCDCKFSQVETENALCRCCLWVWSKPMTLAPKMKTTTGTGLITPSCPVSFFRWQSPSAAASACMCQPVCLPVSACLSVCVSLSVCLSVSACLCQPACLSMSACLSVCVCLSVCLCQPVCLSVSACLSVCVSLSVSLSVSACLPVCVSRSACVCLSLFLLSLSVSVSVPLCLSDAEVLYFLCCKQAQINRITPTQLWMKQNKIIINVWHWCFCPGTVGVIVHRTIKMTKI